MNGSFCAVILQYAFSNSDLKELRTTFIVNCVFNNFFICTAIMLNIVTMYAIRRTSSLPKTRFICSTFIYFLSGQVVETGPSKLQHLPSVEYFKQFIFSCFVPWRCSCKCRQSFSRSSSSQISGACDSQTCCYCGDLYMGVECIYFFIGIVEFLRNSESCSFSYCSYWLYCLLCGVHQDIFNCPTPQETDSVHADTRNFSGS